jgi:hypothetical protein
MPTINGLSFNLDDEFRLRNRRHTEQERDYLRILIQMEGCKQDALTVASIGDEFLLCDGYTTFAICEQNGFEPTSPRVIPFPDRQSVLAWIDVVSAGRRNLTAEELAALKQKRLERVAAAHADGLSNRAIAEQEGVDEKTIRKDLAKAGADQSASDTNSSPPKVTGIDGKEYPAQRLPTMGGDSGGKGGSRKQKPGSEEFDWEAFDHHYGFVARGMEDLKEAYGSCSEFALGDSYLREFRHQIEKWKTRILELKQ